MSDTVTLDIDIADLAQRLLPVINNKAVVGFYIGRTVDHERREGEYQQDGLADQLVPIHWAKSAREAAYVEQKLLDVYHRHPKCRNVADDSRGATNPLSKRQAVYIAIKTRE